MPFSCQSGFSFSEAGIQNYAPSASGVYGIFNHETWIYVGEAENIRGKLVELLKEPISPLRDWKPAGFAYELTSPARRPLRMHELYTELNPVLQPSMA